MKDKREDWPKVASYILIEKDGKYLLIRRCNTGWHDGDFTLPAGHVKPDESALDCVVREAFEEIGVIVAREDIKLVHVIHRSKLVGSAEYIDFYFSTNKWANEPKLSPSVDKIEWRSLDDLPTNTIALVKDVLGKIKAGIAYSEAGF